MVSWKSKMYFFTFPSQYELKYDLDFHRVDDLTQSRAVCPDCCNGANAIVATASPAQKQAQTIPSYFYVAKPKAKVSQQQLIRGLNFLPTFVSLVPPRILAFISFSLHLLEKKQHQNAVGSPAALRTTASTFAVITHFSQRREIICVCFKFEFIAAISRMPRFIHVQYL